jgi:hypothetical protein
LIIQQKPVLSDWVPKDSVFLLTLQPNRLFQKPQIKRQICEKLYFQPKKTKEINSLPTKGNKIKNFAF